MKKRKKQEAINIQKIEQRAMIIGILANLSMALIAWWVFSLTKVQAVFLDGGFSFISAISCTIAIWISKTSKRKSKVFPLGHFLFEPLYAVLKSILTLILLITVTTTSISKIWIYLKHGIGNKIETGPIIYYAIAMVIIGFSLAGAYAYYNKKINKISSILSTEMKSSVIDGILSLGIGIAVLLLDIISPTGSLSFLQYIGGSIITIILVLISIKTPIVLIKRNFVELVDGVVIQDEVVKPIQKIIEQHIPKDAKLDECRVQKVGISFHINIYLTYESETLDLVEFRRKAENLYIALSQKYQNISVNFIPI